MSIKRNGAIGALFALAISAGVYAQTIDLSALETDVNTVFSSIGRDISPRLHQIALSGNELVGEARLHGFTRFYFVVGASVTTMDGIAKILASEDEDDWAYKDLPLSTLVQSKFDEGSTSEDAFNMITNRAFPLPSPRIGFGLPLPLGFEFLGHAFILPSALVDAGKNAAGDSVDFTELDPQAEILTIGGVLRKNILSDKKAFWRPSVSLGVGYTYSHFLMAFDGFSFAALNMDPPDVGMGVLDMSGSMGFETSVHSFGAVLGISKTILKIFTPYVKAAAYYHRATYQSHFKVTASILETNDDGTIKTIDGVQSVVEEIDIDTPVNIQSADVSFLFSSGMEVRLLPVTFLIGSSIDIERPVAEINDFSLTGFKLNGVGVTTSLRIQI